MALYEIFYIAFVQERAAEYMEHVVFLQDRIKEVLEGLNGWRKEVQERESKIQAEQLSYGQNILREIENICEENGETESLDMRIYKAGVFRLLVVEFSISLHAMCDLLMIFEAMHVCDYKMRGMQHLSLDIHDKLDEIFEKELATLESFNHKRYTRYRDVNLKLEEMQKNQYPTKEDIDIAGTIYTFMEELCKPVGQRNKEILRGLEVLLGYPVYMGTDILEEMK